MSWLKELGYLIHYFSLVLLNKIFQAPAGELNPSRQNIILVYGFAGTPSTMLPLKHKLEEAGYNVLIPDMGWARKHRIDVFAERLNILLQEQDKMLEEKHQKTLMDLKDRLILFGHSMGGLIILAAQRNQPDLQELPVVTVGTPLWGSPLAYLIPWSKPGREMMPDSEWLKCLRQDIAEHPRKLIHIRAKSDEAIPKNSGALEGYPVHTTSFKGHAALVFKLNPEIFRTIPFQ